MKKSLFILIVLFMMLSCSKEQENQNRELNISIKSTAIVTTTAEAENVNFYPNPFHDLVAVSIRDSNEAQLIISNKNGDKKKFLMTTSMATFDFSNEKDGSYYCEVLINNTVYTTYLIKY